MKTVFVTGATGFIGSAIVKELLGAGHQVIGLARSEASAQALTAAGARVHRGSLEDIESLRSGAALADSAIHTAFFHEFTHARFTSRLRVLLGGAPGGIMQRFLAKTVETDKRAIETIGRSLSGADRALVVACGTLSLRPGRLATEDEAPDPTSVGAQRVSEAATMEMNAFGVRACVIRLPPLVHGDGDRNGFTPRLIATARKTGASAFIGDGRNHWAAVHRSDAARLFRLALEHGAAAGRYHAIGDEGIPTRTIAEAIGRRLDLPAVSIPAGDATKRFSWLGPFFSVDNPASGALTQQRLDWRPTGPGLLADLAGPWYVR